MALADGAHAYVTPRPIFWIVLLMLSSPSSVEEFSYFTLCHEATADAQATSLFGISCSRQLDANELINRPADVTRSTVQKAVVVIFDSPQYFGQLREKLSIVTKAWFAQKYVIAMGIRYWGRGLIRHRDFSVITILEDFQQSLAKSVKDSAEERDQYFG